MFTEFLLCVRRCTECFTCIISQLIHTEPLRGTNIPIYQTEKLRRQEFKENFSSLKATKLEFTPCLPSVCPLPPATQALPQPLSLGLLCSKCFSRQAGSFCFIRLWNGKMTT